MKWWMDLYRGDELTWWVLHSIVPVMAGLLGGHLSARVQHYFWVRRQRRLKGDAKT